MAGKMHLHPLGLSEGFYSTSKSVSEKYLHGPDGWALRARRRAIR